LLRGMLDTFSAGDLVVGDAFYGTYFMLSSLLEKQVDFLFEQHGARKRVTDFRRGKALGTKDHVIHIQKPLRKPNWMSQDEYDALPESLTIRELKIKDKILITSMLSPSQYSKQDLKALYKKRWHVEVDLRNIKTTLGMDILSCKTPAMAEKEMWVYLLAYNLIRLLMAQSALLSDLLPRQLSFKHTVQIWLAWSQMNQVHGNHGDEALLFLLIAQRTVGNRPNRVEPRAVKRRPKAFPLLMLPREIARENIKIHGHPKKIRA